MSTKDPTAGRRRRVRRHAVLRFKERVAPLPWRGVLKVLARVAVGVPPKADQQRVPSIYKGIPFVAVVDQGVVITVYTEPRDGVKERGE